MRPELIIHCNSCKHTVVTTLVQATFEVIQGEQYQLKLISLALCDDCEKVFQQNTITGIRLAECLIGGQK